MKFWFPILGGNSLLELKTGGGSASPETRPGPLHVRCGARAPGPAAWLRCSWEEQWIGSLPKVQRQIIFFCLFQLQFRFQRGKLMEAGFGKASSTYWKYTVVKYIRDFAMLCDFRINERSVNMRSDQKGHEYPCENFIRSSFVTFIWCAPKSK